MNTDSTATLRVESGGVSLEVEVLTSPRYFSILLWQRIQCGWHAEHSKIPGDGRNRDSTAAEWCERQTRPDLWHAALDGGSSQLIGNALSAVEENGKVFVRVPLPTNLQAGGYEIFIEPAVPEPFLAFVPERFPDFVSTPVTVYVSR